MVMMHSPFDQFPRLSAEQAEQLCHNAAFCAASNAGSKYNSTVQGGIVQIKRSIIRDSLYVYYWDDTGHPKKLETYNSTTNMQGTLEEIQAFFRSRVIAPPTVYDTDW